MRERLKGKHLEENRKRERDVARWRLKASERVSRQQRRSCEDVVAVFSTKIPSSDKSTNKAASGSFRLATRRDRREEERERNEINDASSFPHESRITPRRV